MDFSRMTQKWSSKPKEDRAARVRENQRRHRARTKAYVTSLEQQLAETKAQLERALSRTAELEAELEKFRSGTAPTPAPVESSPPPLLSAPHSQTDAAAEPSDDLTREASLLLALAAEEQQRATTDCSSVSPCPAPPPPVCGGGGGGPPSCASGSVTAAMTQSSAPQSPGRPGTVAYAASDPDCSHLPPPAPGESTIHCKTAYGIIEERNLKGMDLAAIQEWLGPGFRRAIIRGDGCRVDSHLVFALIDDISSAD